ncbi:DUF7668 domain-containing protein [Pseudoduganella namucuonensis]|uniref:DUF7668 domain-containing protein n=1 Tax=Pseudoduganella namucuonensis TaxID=1035707 RepID=UPI000B88CC4D|nr:hypothetical protein [Pseudoduganella namucuonensis]
MAHFSHPASDNELIEFVDKWASLLESEDYTAAYSLTSHDKYMKWTPELIREAIKSYDECRPEQRVTVVGKFTDISQRKEVTRWSINRHGYIGEIWYDLNIDGYASDLTATFGILESSDDLTIELSDIHVM